MTRLFRWFAEMFEDGRLILYGIVTGHRKLPDGMPIHTSPVQAVFPDPEKENGYIFKTKKSEFHVTMDECHYELCRIASGSDIPGFDRWITEQEQYSMRFAAEESAAAVEGSVLLRLGNNREHYFNAMDVAPGNGEHLSGGYWVHDGLLQDSVLCWAEGEEWCSDYDLRYFSNHNGNIEFYHWDTLGLPIDIENCGDCELRVMFDRSVYIIAPNERVRVKCGNASRSQTAFRDSNENTPMSDKTSKE